MNIWLARIPREKEVKEILYDMPRRFYMMVDLRKPFDAVAWKAIDSTLKGMGFSEEIRRILD